MLSMLRPGGRDRGSAAIEVAILMPVFVALFATAVVVGRLANTLSAVEAATYAGARTASLARDAGTAQEQAAETVAAVLADRGVACVDGPALDPIDPAVFAVPVGTPSSVTVTVSCEVTFSDIDLTGVPADQTITASFTSPIDQYRARP